MARAEPLSTDKPLLYERDFYLWTQAQAALLREGRHDQLDVANLLEEIEDMGRSEKRAIENNLTVLITHLLKYPLQPDQRSSSWRGSIVEHRRRLRKPLKESPSLWRHASGVLAEAHRDAREQASAETGLPIEAFPEHSPYTLDQVLDSDSLPE